MRPAARVAAAVRWAAVVSMQAFFGCATQPTFPPPLEVRHESQEITFAFDTDRDRRPDFWQFQGADGRKHALAYAGDRPGLPGPRIVLDGIDPASCPHFIIALDGVPFELVEELYRAGHFRLFYPPARVICCFPSMTDVALADVFHSKSCLAYQAYYFDRRANRMSDGNAVYLSGRNSPWVDCIDYRCSFWWDALVYLSPRAVFNHELNGMVRTFRALDAADAAGYSVGTAGLGTRRGRAAILAYLRTIDRLCEQLVYERRGRVNITLTADHGHNLVENRRISFGRVLDAGGYRLSKSIRGPRDVVAIAYGLVTYADFYTDDPAGVARCLVQHEDVEFACYPAGEWIVVRDRAGEARIGKPSAGFVYDSHNGDPLKLAPILHELREKGKVSHAGEIDDDAFFAATVDHYYPDPLVRIWRAFHGLVEHPPDLIVSLCDGTCYGSRFFHFMIGRVGSTHGSLSLRNSTTFAMTMLGPLPRAMRSDGLLPRLENLRARRIPTGTYELQK